MQARPEHPRRLPDGGAGVDGVAGVCRLPLIIQLGISLTDAYFEAMSGLTTTGATVLTGLDDLPASINLWRTSGMDRRHGLDRARGGHSPAARHRRPADVQGRNAGADEGLQDDAAHRRDRQGPVGGLCRHHAGLRARLPLGRHELASTRSCMPSRPWDWAVFPATTRVSAIFNSLAIELVSIVFMLIAGMNFATHFSWPSVAVRCVPTCMTRKRGWFLAVTLFSVVGIAVFLVGRDLSRIC